VRKAYFPSGDGGQSHRSGSSLFSVALRSSPADVLGRGEGAWALMETEITPKQENVSAINNFFIFFSYLILPDALSE
jgi:hypothetical protein